MNAARDAVIELTDVSFRYAGTDAGVHGIDLTIRPGELVAIIGASGCGKSTLLKVIAGFLPAQAGRVAIGGRDATGLPPRRRDLGVVFQSYALFPHMRAWENVAYPLKLRGHDRAIRQRAARAMLERVGMTAHANMLPAQLSGGQQQRIALARALVFNPKALLLDEPLSALDAALRQEMRDEIRRLQRDHAIATLHITHDQEEALSMADRVAVMAAGRLVQIGAPREIYERPATRAVAAFVGQANLWDGRIAGPSAVDTALGRLVTLPHGGRDGAAVTVLVRPERLRLGRGPDGVNQFTGAVARDRFLGSLRRFDYHTASGIMLGETSEPGDISAVHIPPAAVQLLPAAESIVSMEPERSMQ